MIPKIKLFAWKLITDKILIREHLRSNVMEINDDCLFCENQEENIVKCCFVQDIWNATAGHCLRPIESNLKFID